MPAFAPLSKKFWDGVITRHNDCWGWRRHKSAFGYGSIGHLGRTLNIHRVSWELHNGPIPKGKHVLHRCDNPECSNPDHLFLGTASDNIRDAWNKGRMPRFRHGGFGRSGVKGVIWSNTHKKWIAMVHRPKPLYIGLFNTIEEAKAALNARRNSLIKLVEEQSMYARSW